MFPADPSADFQHLERRMQEHEQRPGSDDIDHSTGSSPESKAASEGTSMPGNAAAADPAAHGAEMDSPPEQTVHDQSADRGSAADRRPLANSGQYLLPLILSGVIATISSWFGLSG